MGGELPAAHAAGDAGAAGEVGKGGSGFRCTGRTMSTGGCSAGKGMRVAGAAIELNVRPFVRGSSWDSNVRKKQHVQVKNRTCAIPSV